MTASYYKIDRLFFADYTTDVNTRKKNYTVLQIVVIRTYWKLI